MLWLQMTRNISYGSASWEYNHCLWSPTRKQSRGHEIPVKWPFWEVLLRVEAGDQVLHLRGAGRGAAFTGFSTAQTNGFETLERPPVMLGPWAHAHSFYRVLLTDFVPFVEPISLHSVFDQRRDALVDYFRRNGRRARSDDRRLLFYVVQAGGLRCLNGAYLSEVDDELAAMLLGRGYSIQPSAAPQPTAHVDTAECIRELGTRVGQKRFSNNVRANFGSCCCFPGCTVSEPGFLVGSHIARWADAPELRGSTANGLCFCLMHDRAFEEGFFTVGSDLRVTVNTSRAQHSDWCKTHVMPFDGHHIGDCRVTPSTDALRLHWERIGFTPAR